ncbi:hypothetical protein [Alicyclobacillus sp. ALC3]|uniref:hypothetical protein n=1 Tax=Alicyclobacillus sp. ALC3 TaxID=2796143 RepID=UPI0023787E35|nr:hypothetical protein [Alicyclobacillus sp. ALC3]WDL98785.1 hypothetical protein JC200_09080 [Alicyclobacillus sp. ALC3]
MRVIRRTTLVISVLVIVALGVRFFGGSFTSRGALLPMLHSRKNATVVDDLNFGWAQVYVVKTNSGYVTAVVQRQGLFWHLLATGVTNKTSDPVQTISRSSVDVNGHQLGVLAVETTTTHVRAIEVGPLKGGPTSQIQKKIITPGHPIVFTWKSTIVNYQAVALSNKGKELYYYGYPKNTNTINSSQLRWYPAS